MRRAHLIQEASAAAVTSATGPEGRWHYNISTGVLTVYLGGQSVNEVRTNLGRLLAKETGVPADVVEGLRRRGHTIVPPPKPIGGAQAIWIDWDEGVLTGGSDPRKDGCAIGY